MEIIAHRGRIDASLQNPMPENSMAGLAACIESGLSWAEVDVCRTRDGCHILARREPVEPADADAVPRCDIKQPARLAEALKLTHNRLGLYLDCRWVDPLGLFNEIRTLPAPCNLIASFDAPFPASVVRDAPRGLHRVACWDGRSEPLEQLIEQTACTVIEMFAPAPSREHAEAARRLGITLGCITLRANDCREWWLRCRDLGAAWIMTDKPLEARDAIHE